MGFAVSGGLLVVLNIFGLFSVGFSSSYFGAALFWLLVGAGLILFGFKVFGESAEEKQLSKAIAEKQAEIARHRQIVKS